MNNREKQVLEAIIEYHIENGESLASRTLEKKYKFGISSATIRNIMSDLEEIGFLKKNHVSSGRIPTVEGYKAYLKEIFKEDKYNYRNDIYEKIYKDSMTISELYESISNLISEFTQSLGFVIEHSVENEKVSNIKLVYINDNEAAVSMVINNKIVKNSLIQFPISITSQMIDQINKYLDTILNVSDKQIKVDAVIKFLETIGKISKDHLGKAEIKSDKYYFKGLINLQNYPKEILNYLEDIQNISDILLKENYELNKNIVTFGMDINPELLADLTIVHKTYEISNTKVTIGVIAPIRLDYEKIFSYLDSVQDISEYIVNKTNNIKRLEGGKL